MKETKKEQPNDQPLAIVMIILAIGFAITSL